MAYIKNVWSDRLVDHPHRYKLTPLGSDVYDLSREEGTIISGGTLINAAIMNNIEDGIENVDTRTTTLEWDVSNIGLGIANLNNKSDAISKYIDAVAGDDGDFYVDLSSHTTLTNGLKLNITFPAATVPTANARLSIDGGSTYTNVKLLRGAATIPASLIQSQNLIMRYDGTNFILENNLVAYYKFASSLNSTGAITLDLNADGGVYDIVVSGSSSASTPYWFLYNGVASSATYNNQRLYFRATTVDTVNATDAVAGFMYTNSAFNSHQLTMPAGFPTSIQSNGIRGASGLMEGLYYIQTLKTAQPNITSLTIQCPVIGTLFNTGTEIKIYKRGC